MRIDGRYNGPPGTGNGGYTAGLLASYLDSPVVTVTLRQPPPLDTDLTVLREDPVLRVVDGDRTIAVVEPARQPAGPVAPVSEAVAREAMADYPGFTDHPFPTCYVCGPRRARGDGLRVFPGPLPGGRTAAVFTAPTDVHAATLWAALDCPGGWAIISPGRPYVLGRITASVRSVPAAGTDCVVVGEAVATQGRKAQVRSTLYGPDGAQLAAAEATWIAI